MRVFFIVVLDCMKTNVVLPPNSGSGQLCHKLRRFLSIMWQIFLRLALQQKTSFKMTTIEVYSKKGKSIKELIESLKSKLKTTGSDFKKNPNNWGFIGSLEHVETRLKELVDFLG